MDKPDAWTRRLKLLQLLLHRGRMTTLRVTNALNVDRRQGLGDLKALQDHGVPVWPNGEGREREWVLEESWRQVGLSLGLSERLSLMLGRELVESFLHSTDIGEALAKLDRQVGAMSDGAALTERELARRFLYIREPGKDYRDQREAVHLLMEAILAGHRVSFDYRHARPPHEVRRYGKVAPYTMALYKRGLYVFIDRRGEITPHAVERIDGLETHPELLFDYPLPSEYDPRKMFAERFGLADDGSPAETVQLRFTAEGKPYAVVRQWMPDQQVVERDDGGCDIIFRATGLELVSRVLEYGALVEVIKPQALRERVAHILRRATARYTDVPT